jgi:hypothetical protein
MEGPRTLEQGRPIQRHTVHILVTPTSLLYREPGLRIRIHLIRIRIQHFGLNADPDPAVLMTEN